MHSLKGHNGPRQYLDARFTYETPGAVSRVLKWALVKMRVYYAAVESVIKETGAREVFAVVCLVYYNRRDREGYIFGYKDMTESMGPCEAECPTPILDLLSETGNENAIDWRDRCRQYAAARQSMAMKPSPRPGQTIVFDEPLSFSDGNSLKEMRVVVDPRSHRAMLFQDPHSGALYRIRNIKRRTYRLVSPQYA
jgi:hypothetical protein